MRVRVEQLVDELKGLRKGRGILASAITDRIGPALRAVTGTAAEDRPPDVRRKVGGSLLRWAEDLPHDLRLAVLIAFALAEDGRLPYYKDRVRLVAARLNRDERTARRRIDEGIGRLAEVAAAAPTEAAAPNVETGAGWHTEELRTSLALDQPTPEVFETRRIMAERDNLDHVDLAFTLTSDPSNGTIRTDDLEIDIFHGGRLARVTMESGDRYGFRLILPQPLHRDESHQIGMRFRMRRDRPMAPHYVCVPRHRCVEFDLRVRFDLDRLPAQVWRLAHAFQRDIEDPLAVHEPLQLDGAGEIHTRFHELTPGLAYGIRWS
ncbi:hypothetical protein [Actinocrispum wychmicini]|uniref:Uncharacterized protein n=1 Tax=Actinocrispum wychmicini TaxID=1213861 RepID=A0A4R2JUF5_9PSEU|nr:hypothetical protein [Actinocrispum wychmicini]TCO62672.1 hypothetical protein EV192_102811 [Actinocrispum wychmicini]